MTRCFSKPASGPRQDVPLVFVSYWASETGHDYQTILDHGFSARVRQVQGAPVLMPVVSR